jgi:hypothetical protein
MLWSTFCQNYQYFEKKNRQIFGENIYKIITSAVPVFYAEKKEKKLYENFYPPRNNQEIVAGKTAIQEAREQKFRTMLGQIR